MSAGKKALGGKTQKPSIKKELYADYCQPKSL